MPTYSEKLKAVIADETASDESRMRARLALFDLTRWLEKTEAFYTAYWRAYPDRNKPQPVVYPHRINGVLVNEVADYSHHREMHMQPNTDPNREYNAICRPAPSSTHSQVRIVSHTRSRSGRKQMVITDPYKK
jgi:hypothetical protein